MSHIEKIQKIDARLGEIAVEIARLEGIARAAESVASAVDRLAVEVEQVQARRRKSVGDLLLGLVKREDVAVIDAEACDIEQRAEQARADAELRRLGAAEIRERTQPLHRERAELDRQRDLLARQHVREQAELEARTYRDTALALATSLARTQVYAGILADLEHLGSAREVPRHERLSFRAPAVGVLELPAAEDLTPTSDAAFGTLSVAIAPRFRANGQCRASVPFEKIAGEIEQQLRAANLLL